jgi:hypothetical protein
MRSAALLLVGVLAVLAPPGLAQTVTIAPASPDTSSFITVTTEDQTGCLLPPQVTAANHVLRAVQRSDPHCVFSLGPAVPSVVRLGRLPAGDYTYELYAPNGGTLVATTTFTVAAVPPPASVPFNDSYGLAFLSVLFVLAGAMAVGRVA